MTTNLERELKLQAPKGFSLARLPRDLKSYVASPAQFKRLHTVYYDTADFRLMRWGCSLRYRGDEGWTLKLPVLTSDKALSREEHVFSGDPQHVPDAAIDLATAYLRGKPILRVAELRTVRTKREVRDDHGERLAEVVEDDVRVVDGTHVEKRFHQIEIELQGGVSEDALDAIADVLRSEGAGPPDATPKDVAAISDGTLRPEVEIPQLNSSSIAIDVVRAALGKSITQLVRSDAKLRLSDDAEAVHQARVAVRRLRSHLRSFLPILENDWAGSLRERLRSLQDNLAAVRDADVLAANLEELSEELTPADAQPARAVVERMRETARKSREALRSALREPRYVELLDALVEAAVRPHALAGAERPARDVGPELIHADYRRLRKAVKGSGTVPSDRELHKIRIKSKHVRYGAESFADVIGRTASDIAVAAARLQTILGDQHDSVIAVKRLRELIDSPHAFTAGELAALATAKGMRSCRKWRKAWRKVRSCHQKLIN